MQIIEYPLWRIATEKILNTFEEKGYGIEFTHQQIKSWMGISEPNPTIKDIQQHNLDYLSGLKYLKQELLELSNICLHPITGKGYIVLHPKDQIRKGVDRYIKRSQKALSKSGQILANVDINKLDNESRTLQLEKMNRLAFLKAAFRKRLVLNVRTKQIK